MLFVFLLLLFSLAVVAEEQIFFVRTNGPSSEFLHIHEHTHAIGRHHMAIHTTPQHMKQLVELHGIQPVNKKNRIRGTPEQFIHIQTLKPDIHRSVEHAAREHYGKAWRRSPTVVIAENTYNVQTHLKHPAVLHIESLRPLDIIRPVRTRGGMKPIALSPSSTTAQEILVGIVDTGCDTQHPFFENSGTGVMTMAYNATSVPSDSDNTAFRAYVTFMDSIDEYSGHGTHVTGIARRASQGSRIVVLDIACNSPDGCQCMERLGYECTENMIYPPDDIMTTFLGPLNVTIINNSWGTLYSPAPLLYGWLASYIDTMANIYGDRLILFAAGNDGSFGGATIGEQALAKNSLTVGALGSTLQHRVYFSSCGPTPDGRISPQILAPGTGIESAMAGTNTTTIMSGTSMATPYVAGVVTLLGKAGPGSLLRAIILGTSEPTTFSFCDGYGKVNITESTMDTVTIHSAETHTLSRTGQYYTFDLDEREDSSAFVSIMLVWNDPAASPTAGQDMVLVNDLDLIVGRARGNHMFYNNRLHGDHINSFERIVVRSTHGMKIIVRANNLWSPQTFSLVSVHTNSTSMEKVVFVGDDKPPPFHSIITCAMTAAVFFIYYSLLPKYHEK